MRYTLSDIAAIWQLTGDFPNLPIHELLLDSRKLSAPQFSLFFALKGDRRNGHQYIPELYKKGVRYFVISDQVATQLYPDAYFFKVPDTLAALQSLAASWRKEFLIPVIAITGSNGKTIVKEWLYQCLHSYFKIVRSPRSYNSQIGVPLSIWQMDESHELAIFEAGISQPGEMQKLQKMLQPGIGILTNLADAHNEGFKNANQKKKEKLLLFRQCDLIIARYRDIKDEITQGDFFDSNSRIITWGEENEAEWVIEKIRKTNSQTAISIKHLEEKREFQIPFTDQASIENAITCYVVMRQLNLSHEEISSGLLHLQAVDMRLQQIAGINHCNIINDSYSADLHSLNVALQFMQQQADTEKKTMIISDFLQNATVADELYPRIYAMAKQHGVSRIFGIGEQITKVLQQEEYSAGSIELHLFATTSEFLQQFKSHWFREETILIKGARVFGFEQIVAQLSKKAHQTVLEINLNAVAQNVKAYQQVLKPNTKMMAMVKAFAYGSGAEIAGLLQFHQIDYLGVAYADEGVELRKAGIHLPVMVMNPEPSAFELITEYRLEPVLFSPGMLMAWENHLQQEGLTNWPVHIEVETGMHRLGFASGEWDLLAEKLGNSSLLKVQSLFSHLAASEDPSQDEYTMYQFNLYQQAASKLKAALPYTFLQHIANTAAISRLPQLQMDMVRLGIGMYGIDSAQNLQAKLLPAATLRTSIAQIKLLEPSDTVGYNRRGKLERPSKIATVRIGYADGYPRILGSGKGKMRVNGHLAPVVGSICMDMTMLDVTDIPDVKEGDDVVVFGAQLPIQDLAAAAGTIPYEIMTGISQRVKRVYFEE